MLVLSRHRDERIIIRTPDGYEIIVVVVDLRGDKVRLGFEAPTEVEIDAEEVREKIDRDLCIACSHPAAEPNGHCSRHPMRGATR
jgi:carbon storage regulator